MGEPVEHLGVGGGEVPTAHRGPLGGVSHCAPIRILAALGAASFWRMVVSTGMFGSRYEPGRQTRHTTFALVLASPQRAERPGFLLRWLAFRDGAAIQSGSAADPTKDP